MFSVLRPSCAGWESCTSRSCTIESGESTALRRNSGPSRWPTGSPSSTGPRLQVPAGEGAQALLSLWFLCEFSFDNCGADTLDRTVGERRHVVSVELAVAPRDLAAPGGSCEVAFTEELGAQLSTEIKAAVENGVNGAYLQGIISSCKPFCISIIIKQGPLLITFNARVPFRSIAGLSFTGCSYVDPTGHHGTRNISCHGLGLRVPLHAEGKPFFRLPVFTLEQYKMIDG